MVRLFDLSALKLTRAQGAQTLELINQNLKPLALSPQSVQQLEKLARAILTMPKMKDENKEKKDKKALEDAAKDPNNPQASKDGTEASTDDEPLPPLPDDILRNFDLTPLRLSAGQCFKVCQLLLEHADLTELDVEQASLIDEYSQDYANAESDGEEQEAEAQLYERHLEDLECVVVDENKRKLCRLYLIGECPFSELCPLRHPNKEELDKLLSYYSSLPCRNFDRCRLKNCLYQHPGGPAVGSLQDQYLRRVVRAGRTTVCFRFLSGICENTPETCTRGIHPSSDEAERAITRCKSALCRNGPECRVSGCLFNHNGFPIWYVPKSRDSVWFSKGWDAELEEEKREIQSYYEAKLLETSSYYEKKLRELDEWYSAKVRKLETCMADIESRDRARERVREQAYESWRSENRPSSVGGTESLGPYNLGGHTAAPPPPTAGYHGGPPPPSTVGIHSSAPLPHNQSHQSHHSQGYATPLPPPQMNNSAPPPPSHAPPPLSMQQSGGIHSVGPPPPSSSHVPAPPPPPPPPSSQQYHHQPPAPKYDANISAQNSNPYSIGNSGNVTPRRGLPPNEFKGSNDIHPSSNSGAPSTISNTNIQQLQTGAITLTRKKNTGSGSGNNDYERSTTTLTKEDEIEFMSRASKKRKKTTATGKSGKVDEFQ